MDRVEPGDADADTLRAEAESTLDLSRPRPDFRDALGDLRLPALAGAALDRGTALAQVGRYPEALVQFRRAITGGPEAFRAAGREGGYEWACYAVSVLYRECGDVEGYRRHVRLIRETVHPGDHPSDLERPAKASLLAPPPNRAEAEALRAMAEAAVERPGPSTRPDPGISRASPWPSTARAAIARRSPPSRRAARRGGSSRPRRSPACS